MVGSLHKEVANTFLCSQVFWDGKWRKVKAVIRHQMQCLAQYFPGKRSRYEPFRLDAVKLVARTRGFRVRGPSLGKAADLKDGGLRYAC